MAYYWEELAEQNRISRSDNGTVATRHFELSHSDVDISFLESKPAHRSPHPTLPNMYIRNISYEPHEGKVRAVFEYREPDLNWNVYVERWTWNLGTRQQHVTSVRDASYEAHYPANKEGQLAIGYDGKNVDGVDIQKPYGVLKCEKRWSYVTTAGIRLLNSLQTTVNLGPIWDYYAGEILFNGGTVREGADGLIYVTYEFNILQYQPVQNFELLDGSTVAIQPNPWDYVWFRHGEKLVTNDDGDKEKKKGIKSVHLAQNYEYTDFSLLGLVGPY